MATRIFCRSIFAACIIERIIICCLCFWSLNLLQALHCIMLSTKDLPDPHMIWKENETKLPKMSLLKPYFCFFILTKFTQTLTLHATENNESQEKAHQATHHDLLLRLLIATHSYALLMCVRVYLCVIFINLNCLLNLTPSLFHFWRTSHFCPLFIFRFEVWKLRSACAHVVSKFLFYFSLCFMSFLCFLKNYAALISIAYLCLTETTCCPEIKCDFDGDGGGSGQRRRRRR